MKKSFATAITGAAFVLAGAVHAQTAGNLLGGPALAAGGVVSAAAAGHAQIAPTVNRVSPTVEPITDGVTNAVAALGTGVTGTGQQLQANGLMVGATSSGKPLVSVGASQPATQGSVAAVLNGRP